MKNSVRIISMLMCLLMVMGILVSCKGKGTATGGETTGVENPVPQDSVATQPSGEEGETWELDENGYAKDKIPEVDLGGRKIAILAWSEGESWSLASKSGGDDVIMNEVFIRNLDLKERLNIEIAPVFKRGSWQNNAADRELLNAALAGTEEYDLIQSYSLWPPIMATNGILLNMLNYQFPSFEMPWWPDALLDSWTQYGALFYAADNSSIRVVHSIETMYVNLAMLDNYGVNDILTTVIDGKWTLDKLYEYSGFFHGDAMVDNPDDKLYGLVVDDHSRMDAFYYSTGFNTTVNNAEGKAELAFTSQTQLDRITSMVDKVIAIMNRPEATIAKNTQAAMFNKQTAFMVCALGDIIRMEADLSYAAIPMPKLDEDQENYQAINNNGYDVWAIPNTAKDPETSALIIEAFASSDYRHLAPFFYDRYLKGRYAVSWQGAEIYDMIRGSVKFDWGRTGANLDAVGYFRPCFWTGTEVSCNNVFATKVAAANGSRQLEAALRETLDKYRQYASVK